MGLLFNVFVVYSFLFWCALRRELLRRVSRPRATAVRPSGLCHSQYTSIHTVLYVAEIFMKNSVSFRRTHTRTTTFRPRSHPFPSYITKMASPVRPKVHKSNSIPLNRTNIQWPRTHPQIRIQLRAITSPFANTNNK